MGEGAGPRPRLDEVLREPILAIAVGNPVWVALLQQTEKWATNLAMGLVVAVWFPCPSARRAA